MMAVYSVEVDVDGTRFSEYVNLYTGISEHGAKSF